MAVAGSVQANLASDFAPTNGGRVPGQQFLLASYGGWPDGQMARGWHMWYVLERLLQKGRQVIPPLSALFFDILCQLRRLRSCRDFLFASGLP